MRLAWLAVLLPVAALAQLHPAAREEILSPVDCAGPANILSQGEAGPFNGTFMRVRNMGDAGTPEQLGQVSREVTWDVGRMTGLHVPSFYQRGYRDEPPPVATSAFQLACNAAGFFINTFEFGHTKPLTGEGQNVSLIRLLDPRPIAFPDTHSAFAIQAYMTLPTVYSPGLTAGSGVTQLSFFYYVRDRTTGTLIAHVIGVHDNRPRGLPGTGDDGEGLGHDTITAFAGSPLAPTHGSGKPVRFVEPGAYSSHASIGATWSGEEFFRAEIPYERFRTMIDAIRASGMPGTGISPEPLDYELVSAGVLAEVFVGTERGHDVMFGGSVRDLSVVRARRVPLVGRSR